MHYRRNRNEIHTNSYSVYEDMSTSQEIPIETIYETRTLHSDRASLISLREIEFPIVLFPDFAILREKGRINDIRSFPRLEEAITLHGLLPPADSTSFKMAVDQSPCYPCIGTAVCTCINGVIQDTRVPSELRIGAPSARYTLASRLVTN